MKKIDRKESLKLCGYGGMFGAHLFYWGDHAMGVLMAIVTLFGIYDFVEHQSVFIIAIPALINLYTFGKLYGMTNEQFDKEFNQQ